MTTFASQTAQGPGFSYILGWSLVALIIGAVLMTVINLLQNPPWPTGDDSRPSDETR